MATKDNLSAQRIVAALALKPLAPPRALPPLGDLAGAFAAGVPTGSAQTMQRMLPRDALPTAAAPAKQDPIVDILAGAKNAPVVKRLPADWVGVPDPVRRAFQSPDTRAAFFPAESPAMKQVREQLEAEGATGFYTPSQSEVYIRPGMTPAEERFTAYHEVAGHYGLQGAMGDDYSTIMARAMENPTVARLSKAMRSGSSNYEGEDDVSAADEALSELAAARRTGDYDHIERDWGVHIPTAERAGFAGMLSRIVQLTKRKLADLTGEEPHAFNDEQVHRLISDAWRYVQRPRPKTPAEKGAELHAAAAAAMDAGIAEASRQEATRKSSRP